MSVAPKAIRTTYGGVQFRSRLEARWAVFFDGIREPWQHEPQGYFVNGYEPYLPDFWMPGLDAFWEVKPTDDVLWEEPLNRLWHLPEATGKTLYVSVGPPRLETAVTGHRFPDYEVYAIYKDGGWNNQPGWWRCDNCHRVTVDHDCRWCNGDRGACDSYGLQSAYDMAMRYRFRAGP